MSAVNIHEKAFYEDRVKTIQEIIEVENTYEDLILTAAHLPGTSQFVISGFIKVKLNGEPKFGKIDAVILTQDEAESPIKVKEYIRLLMVDYMKIKIGIKNG